MWPLSSLSVFLCSKCSSLLRMYSSITYSCGLPPFYVSLCSQFPVYSVCICNLHCVICYYSYLICLYLFPYILGVPHYSACILHYSSLLCMCSVCSPLLPIILSTPYYSACILSIHVYMRSNGECSEHRKTKRGGGHRYGWYQNTHGVMENTWKTGKEGERDEVIGYG